MGVGMLVLMALTATAFLLSVVVHLTGTSDSVLRGVSAAHIEPHSYPQPVQNAQVTANKILPVDLSSPLAAPKDPSEAAIMKKIFHALGMEHPKSTHVTQTISYNNKTVEDGSYVPMDKAAEAPTVTIHDDISDSTTSTGSVYYTWVLLDIDAPRPSDPSHAPFLHAIVANIDPTNEQDAFQVVSYYPVSPPEGNHRYVALVFAQKNNVASDEELSGYDAQLDKNRMNFDVAKYADHEALLFQTYSYFYSHPAKTP